MAKENASSAEKINGLPTFDFDVSDPNGWFHYVADWVVISGNSRRTGETYAREVRILVREHAKPAFLITESEVRDHILARHAKLGGSSQRIMYRGLSILYSDILRFDWQLLKVAKAKREIIEPTILTRAEVARIFDAITTQHTYTYLRTVYSCGLRLSEALNIRVGDIDRDRGVLHVRHGKGGKDRLVTLPGATLRMLEA